MLLCEVALGVVQNVDLDSISDKPAILTKGFDSLKTCDAKFRPDPRLTLDWKGLYYFYGF